MWKVTVIRFPLASTARRSGRLRLAPIAVTMSPARLASILTQAFEA
jgi:hypothetical protein